jgi:hypothetical protein
MIICYQGKSPLALPHRGGGDPLGLLQEGHKCHSCGPMAKWDELALELFSCIDKMHAMEYK